MLLAQRFCSLQGPVWRIGLTAAAAFRSPPRVHRRVARRAEKAARHAAAQAVCSTAPVNAPLRAAIKLGTRLFATPVGQGSATSARRIVVKSFSGSSSSCRCSRTPEGRGFGHVLSAVASTAGLVPALSTCLLVATRYSSSRVSAAFRHGHLLCVVASASTGSGDSVKGMSPWEFRILDGRCQVLCTQ